MTPDLLLSAGIFLLRVLQPFLALLILYHCFTSLRNHRRGEQPLVELKDTISGARIPVVYWENTIGRSKSSDILLPDPAVSRDHAVLYRREEGWMISDTHSKAGTKCNGATIQAPTQVRVGDVITLGSTSLSLERADRTGNIHRSWFFNRSKPCIRPARLMVLVSFFHALLAAQLCLPDEGFAWQPLALWGAFTLVGWLFLLISRRGFHRSGFELETLAFFLSGLGILLIYSVDERQAYIQTAAMALGMVLFCCVLWFMEDPDRVMRWRLPMSILAVLLLAGTLVLGTEVYGAKNWILIGPVSIQPSELVKICFIFVGTSTLNQLQTAKNLTEFLVFTALCIGALGLMGDFGTACIFFVTFLIIAFIRSGNLRTIIFICAGAALGAFVILQRKPYILDRFAAWGHVWEYADTTGYQQTHVLSYAASGGMFGVGIGNGNLKYVAAASSDLVFGMMCEELGVLLALVVALAVAALAVYARMSSATTRSTVYSIAACAAGGMLVFQSCLNIFGATDILPLTGVTLPFVSMGGSSMMAVWGLLAFIKASDERTYAVRRANRSRG
ncbi:MAG TPA: FtsW/RodA/SpoVE family cell cycle protein [Candidatus Gallacutalibacter stercoravium]|nr:FtsW/RodA/SpoVE family cell cycle protein [Candidatus Gallacutalibacter stercoravium]